MSLTTTLVELTNTIKLYEAQTPCRGMIFKALRKHSAYFSGDEGYFFHYIAENDSYIMGVLPMTQFPCFMLEEGDYEQYMLLKETGMCKEAIYLYFLIYGVDNQCKTT